MSVILNQTTFAINALEKYNLGDIPSETIQIIIKYLKAQNYSDKVVKEKICEFLKIADAIYNDIKWVDLINKSIKNAKKYPLKDIEGIIITEIELKTIKNINKKSLEKLAFTLLCLSKYTNERSNKDKYWVNFEDRNIFKMANIQEDIKTQNLMYYDLKELELIKFNKSVESLSVNVCFACEGESCLKITDFRNLGFQYLLWKGENFIHCERCQMTIRRNSNKQKYCKECSSIVKSEQDSDRYYSKI